MRPIPFRLWVWTVLCAWLVVTAAARADSIPYREPAEISLQKAFRVGYSGNFPEAVSTLNDLITQYPNFLPALLLRADLLRTHNGSLPLFAFNKRISLIRIDDLYAELKRRLAYEPHPDQFLPSAVAALSSDRPAVLLFDALLSRIYVIEKEQAAIPVIIGDYYASQGREGAGKSRDGDFKTPVGIYVSKSFIAPQQLPELYGAGAYTLNYPNPVDKLLDYTGSGIWLHGVPGISYSRPPMSSRGCLVVSNAVLQDLASYVGKHSTVFVLSESVQWMERSAWVARKETILQRIEDWRIDWESMDTARYISHYSNNYKDEEKNYDQLTADSLRNAKNKRFIKVTTDNIEIFYERNRQVIHVFFDQKYHSNNYNTSFRKQQIWQIDFDSWKIIYEGRIAE